MKMSNLDGRRKTMFGSHGMKMLDIQKRAGRQTQYGIFSLQGDDVLPWIERYTTGDFYLSDYSIGFTEPNDMLMFKLAFK